MSHRCNNVGGKKKYTEKNLDNLSHHKSQMDWPGPNPGFSEEPATNHVNHGKVHHRQKWCNDDMNGEEVNLDR